jgi:hypothetical protein
MLQTVSWNVENFVKINEMIKHTGLINKLIKTDLIFLQEWKNEEGLILINKLKNLKNHFLFIYVDRCCIIYNSKKLFLQNFVEIKLPFNEKRTLIEKTYTTGAPDSSLLASFKPLIHMDIDILHCVCFHLGALNPKQHKNFHKNQLNHTIKQLLLEIKNNLKNGIIIAGDTNYRTPDNDLVDKLIDEKLLKKLPGDFKDICYDSECLNYNTQSFNYLHETGLAKNFIKKVSTLKVKKCKNDPDSFICKYNKIILDNRLDFIATNLAVNKKKTQVVPYKTLSDHFMVISSIEPTIKSKTLKTLKTLKKNKTLKTLKNKTFKNNLNK